MISDTGCQEIQSDFHSLVDGGMPAGLQSARSSVFLVS